MTHPIDAWHEFVRNRDPGALDALLADDLVFHSPEVVNVLHQKMGERLARLSPAPSAQTTL